MNRPGQRICCSALLTQRPKAHTNMAHVQEVRSLDLWRVGADGGPKMLLQAVGEVLTSQWSDIRLVAHAYADPPHDGLAEFDLLGLAPRGEVVSAPLPVSASIELAWPPWCQGVKVYAATNSETSRTMAWADAVSATGAWLSRCIGMQDSTQR